MLARSVFAYRMAAVVGAAAVLLSLAAPASSQATTTTGCTAPDPVRFPLTWQGGPADHNCTADEARAYDLAAFAYACAPINCQMKYGTDTSDQQFGFDATCRLCTECTGAEAEQCAVPSVIVDDGCDGAPDSCDSAIDCGPHGTNLGLYACTCDTGFKTDVTSGSYCSVADVTDAVPDDAVNDSVDEAGTDIIVAVSVILGSVTLIAICVGALSVNIRNKKAAFYPSGRPIDKDPGIVSFNMISLLIAGAQSEVIQGLLDSIHWPPKSLAARPGQGTADAARGMPWQAPRPHRGRRR